MLNPLLVFGGASMVGTMGPNKKNMAAL